MPTDLPEPVVPAISRWGIRARSVTTGSPPIFLPRASGRREVFRIQASLAIISEKYTVSRFAFGSSMPITVRPGTVAMRTATTLMLRAMSSARPMTREDFTPGAGSSSYKVTTGPGRISVICPCTPKSDSTCSSRRALACSDSESGPVPVRGGAGVSNSSGGVVSTPSGSARLDCIGVGWRCAGLCTGAATRAAMRGSAEGSRGVASAPPRRGRSAASSAARSRVERSAAGCTRRPRPRPNSHRMKRPTSPSARQTRCRRAAPARATDAVAPAVTAAARRHSAGAKPSAPSNTNAQPRPSMTDAIRLPSGPKAVCSQPVDACASSGPNAPPGPARTGAPAGKGRAENPAASTGSPSSSASSRAGSNDTPRSVNSRHAQPSSVTAGRKAAKPKPCNNVSDTAAPVGPARLRTARAVAVEPDGSAGSWLSRATSSARPISAQAMAASCTPLRKIAARNAGEASRPPSGAVMSARAMEPVLRGSGCGTGGSWSVAVLARSRKGF